MKRSENGQTLLISCVLIASLAVYFNTLFNGFVFDDAQNIVGNRWIKDITYIPAMFTSHVAGFDNIYQTSYYRPFVHVIYLLAYQVFGLHPWGFHLVNVLFHSGVSILVFLIVSRLFDERHPSDLSSQPFSAATPPISPLLKKRPGGMLSPPFFAALLFAVHPIHTEAVAWISGVMDLSSAFFFLLSFYLYMRAEGKMNRVYALSLVSFLLAALSKEPALTLPLVLIVYDHVIRKQKIVTGRAVKTYVPYFLIAGMYFVMRLNALGGFAPSKKFIEMTNYQYVINTFPLFIEYIRKLLLPLDLSALYVFHPVNSLSDPKAFLPLILTAVLLSLALLSKKDILILGIMLFVIPLLPALYIPALGDVAFAERYLYLPSVGFVIVMALLCSRAYSMIPNRIVVTGAVIALLAVFGVATVGRNSVWKDEFSLWTDTVRKSPESAVAREYLGYALYERGQVEEAIECYLMALQLKPDYEDAHINLGIAYAARGRIDEAIDHYMKALRIQPNSVEGHNNLGLAYAAKGWTDRAMEQYQIALSINPYFAKAYNNLGSAYGNEGLTQGDENLLDKAIVNFRYAASLDPDNPLYSDNLAAASEAKRRLKVSEQEN